jgi:hypothetical protein
MGYLAGNTLPDDTVKFDTSTREDIATGTNGIPIDYGAGTKNISR